MCPLGGSTLLCPVLHRWPLLWAIFLSASWRLHEQSLQLNDRGDFIRVIEFNFPFLELMGGDARLTAQPSPAVLGDAFSEERCAWCVQSLVFMFLLQTHRDTAPLPTAKLTSNPAGWWAWIPGSESQPLDLTKALYFDQTSIYLVFCHLHLYSLSHRWPGHHIAIFNNLALFLFELYFFLRLDLLVSGGK